MVKEKTYPKYLVTIIKSSNLDEFGEVFLASDSFEEAYDAANDKATAYLYGVAVMNLEDGYVDVGDDVVQLSSPCLKWWRENWYEMVPPPEDEE